MPTATGDRTAELRIPRKAGLGRGTSGGVRPPNPPFVKTRYSEPITVDDRQADGVRGPLLATCRFVASISGTPALLRSGDARVASAELV
jgi:hypothetical protein